RPGHPSAALPASYRRAREIDQQPAAMAKIPESTVPRLTGRSPLKCTYSHLGSNLASPLELATSAPPSEMSSVSAGARAQAGEWARRERDRPGADWRSPPHPGETAAMPEPFADTLATGGRGTHPPLSRPRALATRVEELPIDAASEGLVFLQSALAARG